MFSLWLIIFSFEDFEVKNETASEQSGHHLDEAILHNGGFLSCPHMNQLFLYCLFLPPTSTFLNYVNRSFSDLP